MVNVGLVLEMGNFEMAAFGMKQMVSLIINFVELSQNALICFVRVRELFVLSGDGVGVSEFVSVIAGLLSVCSLLHLICVVFVCLFQFG